MKLIAKSLRASFCLLLLGSGVCNASEVAKQGEAHLNIVSQLAQKSLVKQPKESELKAYLFVYFKDETHSVYFATSKDGYTFTDVNHGNPVLLGEEVAEQKGVRDPHIYRGPDNAFYMSMTDLHIFAKEKGLRATQWERPDETHGWGNNKNLILMKSFNLIDWTLARVNVAQLFPDAGDLGVVWAPETIFDEDKQQLMVYFTTRVGKGTDHLVYSYANSDFNTLTELPKNLFEYPKSGVGSIDADITKVGNKFHMFYVAHEKPGNIRLASSIQLNSGYVFDPQKVDPEPVAAEAPTLWRRHGTTTYVLMYDVFKAKPKNNMGFSETTDFVTFTNLGRFNEPGSKMKATNFANPKHGAVISITQHEAERLVRYFKSKRHI